MNRVCAHQQIKPRSCLKAYKKCFICDSRKIFWKMAQCIDCRRPVHAACWEKARKGIAEAAAGEPTTSVLMNVGGAIAAAATGAGGIVAAAAVGFVVMAMDVPEGGVNDASTDVEHGRAFDVPAQKGLAAVIATTVVAISTDVVRTADAPTTTDDSAADAAVESAEDRPAPVTVVRPTADSDAEAAVNLISAGPENAATTVAAGAQQAPAAQRQSLRPVVFGPPQPITALECMRKVLAQRPSPEDVAGVAHRKFTRSDYQQLSAPWFKDGYMWVGQRQSWKKRKIHSATFEPTSKIQN